MRMNAPTTFRIIPMTREHANESFYWHYDTPYEFYNTPLQHYNENMSEIFDDNGTDFFAALDDEDQLFGTFDFSFPDGMMEIGLGIRPQDTGKGYGREFVRRCIAFGQAHYGYEGAVRLRVADFNARAIRLYTSLGFVETGREQALSHGNPVVFVCMELA